MKTIKYLLFSFVFVLVSCTAIDMSGDITERHSKFDNSAELSMTPSLVFRDNDGFSGSDISLSLYWNSKMPDDGLILEAYVGGSKAFASGDSLFFNIDNEQYSFKSIDRLTDFSSEVTRTGPRNLYVDRKTSKRYLVTRQFVDKMISSKNVAVRVDLRKTYVEGVFSDDTIGSAKAAFKKFMEKLNQLDIE